MRFRFRFSVSSINTINRFKMIRDEYKVRLVFKHGARTSLTLYQSSMLHKRDYMNDEDSFRFKNKLTMDVKSEWEILDIKNDL